MREEIDKNTSLVMISNSRMASIILLSSSLRTGSIGFFPLSISLGKKPSKFACGLALVYGLQEEPDMPYICKFLGPLS